MADLRISQLPALAGAVLQSDDALAIVDLSASETKKLTAKDLIQSGVALIDAGSIPGDKVNVTLAAGSVGTTELADGAVTQHMSIAVVNYDQRTSGDRVVMQWALNQKVFCWCPVGGTPS